MRIAITLMMIITLGCSNLPTQARKLNLGDTKQQAELIMGTPDDVQFKGEDEAWQYSYVVSFGICEYRVLWFTRGQLIGSTSYRNSSVGGCSMGMRAVRWEDKPDQIIEIRRR